MYLIDGVPSDGVPADDRGLAYGDGVFETIAVQNGTLLAWPAHLARLRHGCAVLGFTPPMGDLLEAECGRLAAGRDAAVVKLIVTRGSGGRGYRPPAPAAPRRIVGVFDWPALPPEGTGTPIKVWLCAHRLGDQPTYAGIKHLNRLDQVLASAEWPAADMFEGLMFDADDGLVEGTRSNVFLVRNGELGTPSIERCGVDGIVRQAVLALARERGWPSRIGVHTRETLASADEIFLCNAIIGVRAVTEIAGLRTLAAGPLTTAIAAELRVRHIVP